MSNTQVAAKEPEVTIEDADTATPLVTYIEPTETKGDRRVGRDPDADTGDDDRGSSGGGERTRSSLRRERGRIRNRDRIQQIEQLSGAVTSLDHMVKLLARGQQEQAATTLDGELRNAQLAYQEAQRREAEAISKGDGVVASEARNVMTNASRHYHVVKAQLDQLRANPVIVDQGGAPNGAAPAGAPRRSTRADELKEKFLDEHPWINLDEDTVTARLVRTVDATVAQDQYDANTPDYWDELSDRLRKELPHQFTGNTKMLSRGMRHDDQERGRAHDDDLDDEAPRPRRRGGGPPLGGSGRDGDGQLGPGQFRLNADQVKALEDANIPLVGGSPEQQKRRNKVFEQWRNAPTQR